ncbi:MAG: hypothetical protein KGM47_16495 [Acidobacteriota bacterium]|nr:hypothetical protein [Acidobacteriota bacterium]
MDHSTLIAVFVVIAAVAIVIQMLILLGLFLMAWRVYRRAIFLVQVALEVVAHSREPVKALTSNMAEISRMVRDRAQTLDGVLAAIIERTRIQADRIDVLTSGLMDRMELTAGALERGVLGPLREFSAVARGFTAGFDFLFSRRHAHAMRQTTQDEEMFI